MRRGSYAHALLHAKLLLSEYGNAPVANSRLQYSALYRVHQPSIVYRTALFCCLQLACLLACSHSHLLPPPKVSSTIEAQLQHRHNLGSQQPQPLYSCRSLLLFWTHCSPTFPPVCTAIPSGPLRLLPVSSFILDACSSAPNHQGKEPNHHRKTLIIIQNQKIKKQQKRKGKSIGQGAHHKILARSVKFVSTQTARHFLVSCQRSQLSQLEPVALAGPPISNPYGGFQFSHMRQGQRARAEAQKSEPHWVIQVILAPQPAFAPEGTGLTWAWAWACLVPGVGCTEERKREREREREPQQTHPP